MESAVKNIKEKKAAGNSAEVMVEMKHVKKSFKDNHVLQDVNLTIHSGENVVVLGKSGTGKSVLIKCLVRLLKHDDGELLVFGKNMAEMEDDELNELRKKIGFVFQHSALYDSMTVGENLRFHLRDQRNQSSEEKDKLVHEALRSVGLEDSVDLMPAELSGGMRKRIGLARTMILKPELMLYDEPTAGLDPVNAREISKLILEVQQEYKTTSLIITHDIECARITANRILVLKEGKFEAEGTFEELEKSEDKWVRSFFE